VASPDPDFLRVWAALGARGDPAEVFGELAARYALPARAYHTLEHVRDCLREFELVRHLAMDPEAVEAALWFHDAVYDPRGKENEALSATLMRQTLAGVAEARLSAIEEAILATRHAAPPPAGDPALVVDLDLAVLGEEPARFDRYEALIRREYSFVPDLLFRRKRAAVLASFLARPALYTTPQLRERFEARARENLARSLRRLGGK
jgi:predicted metal-dependent HD superfamily phosphohydrolase